MYCLYHGFMVFIAIPLHTIHILTLMTIHNHPTRTRTEPHDTVRNNTFVCLLCVCVRACERVRACPNNTRNIQTPKQLECIAAFAKCSPNDVFKQCRESVHESRHIVVVFGYIVVVM